MWKVTLDGDRLVFTPFFDEEPKKVSVSTLYGEMQPLPDWDPEKLREDLQDLKLENDRLQQRDKLMWKALVSIGCNGSCTGCLLEDDADCRNAGAKSLLAKRTLEKLEDIG